MTSTLLTVCLVTVGIINLLPAAGMFSANQLQDAYAISLGSNDVEILMRHRALLFGILGTFVVVAAFRPFYRPAAMLMSAVSMIGFILLAHLTGGFNESIHRVLLVDYGGVGFLFLAYILQQFMTPDL